ncbi:MAG: hypothetical protein H6R01_1522 [Burkholderiaceae bacterium]|nr:hypothetical protein [Burkholderiaceae bacterium]
MNRMQTALLDIIRITLAHTGASDIDVSEIIARKTQHFGHEFPLNETRSEGCGYATAERTAA